MSNIIDATVAKRIDIIVKQNQTFDAQLTFIDSSNIPINLTGVNFKLSVRNADGCNTSCECIGDSPFNFVYKQDFTPTYLGSGQIKFNELILLSPGIYKYDLLAEFPGNVMKYLLTGSFKVKRSFAQITT